MFTLEMEVEALLVWCLTLNRPSHMTLRIQAWDRLKIVVGLSQLMASQPSPFYNLQWQCMMVYLYWIVNLCTGVG
jgi:uncharacterized membrane protein